MQRYNKICNIFQNVTQAEFLNIGIENEFYVSIIAESQGGVSEKSMILVTTENIHEASSMLSTSTDNNRETNSLTVAKGWTEGDMFRILTRFF